MKSSVIALLLTTVNLSSVRAETVIIGHAANFTETGKSAVNPYNKDSTYGLMMAIEDFSSELRKKSLTVKIQNFDYGNSSVLALNSAKEAVSSPIVSIIGYYESSQALLAAPEFEKAGLPYISPFSSANRLYKMGEHIHHMSYSNQEMAAAMESLGRKRLKAQNPLIISAADCAYCSDLANSFEDTAVKNGMKTERLNVLSDSTNFEQLDEALKRSAPDLFIVTNYEIDSGRIISHLLSKGIYGPFIGGDGWADANGEGFLKIVSNKKFIGYCVSHWSQTASNDIGRLFLKKWFAKYHEKPTIYAAYAYDSMRRILLALTKAKDISRSGLQNALANLKAFDGVAGKYVYHSPGSSPIRPVLILKSNMNLGVFQPLDRAQ